MKDTCKQTFFRRKNPEQQRSIEDPQRAGDREERELEFFNMLINVWLNIQQSPGRLLKVQYEQLSPEDQNKVFGVDKLSTAYQRKK